MQLRINTLLLWLSLQDFVKLFETNCWVVIHTKYFFNASGLLWWEKFILKVESDCKRNSDGKECFVNNSVELNCFRTLCCCVLGAEKFILLKEEREGERLSWKTKGWSTKGQGIAFPATVVLFKAEVLCLTCYPARNLKCLCQIFILKLQPILLPGHILMHPKMIHWNEAMPIVWMSTEQQPLLLGLCWKKL